jgi:hypothetical protein
LKGKKKKPPRRLGAVTIALESIWFTNTEILEMARSWPVEWSSI